MKGEQLLGKEKASFNLARLKKGEQKFEIAVDADKAVEYKNGKDVDIKDVLTSEKIFSDAHKGLPAPENIMESVFKTSDVLQIADEILKKGEIQLTAEYRAAQREEKRKKIVETIHRNAIDPGTNLPHPPQRIENALQEAKVKIDENKSAEDQIQDVLKQIRPILPIRFEIREIAVKLPAEYAAKSYSIVRSFGTVIKEDWQNDGSLVSVVKVPAGLQEEFFDKLNNMTHGNVETKVLKSN
ncbi:MAG: ribosome assembly factor SBDS [bacterium]|nr:ribosome assembly factor SBDS [bacterium]